MLLFVSEPVDTIGVAGMTTSLHCNVSGHPISSVLWYKDDVLILSDSEQSPSPEKNESDRITSDNISINKSVGLGYWSSMLTLTGLIVTDTGTYHCVATQQDEIYITSKLAELIVQCK